MSYLEMNIINDYIIIASKKGNYTNLKNYPVFANPPITEALIDIRVDLPETISLNDLELFHSEIKELFPHKGERRFLKGGFQFTPQIAATVSDKGVDGYLFRSSTGKKIVQARLDGFTFNKLKPYETWEVFCSEAHKLWDSYSRIVNPTKVKRIALRYINRIEVPMSMKDFREYILTSFEVAPKLPQAVSHFFMRLVIPNPKIEATAIITETMENPTSNQMLPIIFDIDAFRETQYEANDSEIWDDFEKLRNFKNEIFFNSITDKTMELFE